VKINSLCKNVKPRLFVALLHKLNVGQSWRNYAKISSM
jgi:hypothetical protein